MSNSEFSKLIKQFETGSTEFKESFDKEAIETAAAFANTKSGYILIGVSDKGKIKGVQLGKETIKDWVNQITQKIDPRIIPEIQIHTIEKKNVVSILIKEYPIKPVSIKGRCFRRVGNSNRIMTTQEVAQMHFLSSGMSWDKLPARDALIKDLFLVKIKKFIKRANETGRRKIQPDEESLQILKKMELIKDGKPTWAAILLFGNKPNRFLSQATIHCGRFKEEIIVIDDRMIYGNIIEQIEESLDFIQKNINVKFVMTGKPRRAEVWDYPLEALREALINAVCHRDYTFSSNIEIRIFDDELTIWSPGGLPLGITLKELYKPHSSVLRNKAIGEVFYDLELIERWGSGIDKIRKACLNAELPEPQFENNQNGFKIIFRKDIYTEEYLIKLGLNARQIKAVLYVKEKNKITNILYQNICNTSQRTATRDLSNLVSEGVFEQIGITGKGTEYILRRHKDAKGAIKTP